VLSQRAQGIDPLSHGGQMRLGLDEPVPHFQTRPGGPSSAGLRGIALNTPARNAAIPT
jgi:hypothetical protein